MARRFNFYEHSEQARARAPVWGSELTTKAAKKLELIQTLMTQKPMIRADVHVRRFRASQNVIRVKV